jgi:putative protease
MHKIELLSPARDAEIGIEAFNHGADAVYIGAPRFSARAAAGCSVADIERLAAYGHRYGARTFVALNTILTDDELRDAERLTWQL